ncbi:GIY-YIG nuclease family protein [Chryseobacterium sp. CT-SW4]|uniref:GIY-YIG nuclease family protein n=1 Tax=Chryseobacterium sp. SW-1 TaxID=3157343 RepID=UPI003B02D0EA
MKTIGTHNYYVYILTNKNKTVLYTGVTNDLKSRLYWHKNPEAGSNHFTFKYNCFYLVYYEHFQDIELSIAREKQIKGYSRMKKENLINNFNPNWEFLNDSIE